MIHFKQLISILLGHGISSVLGWFAGLFVVQLINSFVEEEGIGWSVSKLWERLSQNLLKTIQS